MYLAVNTRCEGNPILARLGGIPETFFFVYTGIDERHIRNVQCYIMFGTSVTCALLHIHNIVAHVYYLLRGRQVLKLFFDVCEYT